MDPVSVWFTAGLLLAAFSASLFTKARVEEQYGPYVLAKTNWLYRPSANVTATLTVFIAGIGSILVAWWYPVLLLATAIAVAVPGGGIYRSGLEFLHSPGRLGERFRHWMGWDDRQVLSQANALLRRLKRKSSKAEVLIGESQNLARGALVAKAKILVEDRIPRLLALRRALREGITDVRLTMPGMKSGHRITASTFEVLATKQDRLTQDVAEKTETGLKQMEERYAHIEDYLRACNMLLVNLNARWYLLLTSDDPQELEAFMEELDALIDNEGKLLEQTEQQLTVVQ